MSVDSEMARAHTAIGDDASTDYSDAKPNDVATDEGVENSFQVIRRNGSVARFDATKILAALTKAFLAVEGDAAGDSRRVHETISELTDQIVTGLTRRADFNRTFHIDDIQDRVELALMRGEHHKVARAYVLYREDRARERALAKNVTTPVPASSPVMRMKTESGSLVPVDMARMATVVVEACEGLADVSPEPILAEAQRNLYDGVTRAELFLAPILATRTLIETEPNYSKVSARLLLDKMRTEALGYVSGQPEQATQSDMKTRYAEYFHDYIKVGIKAEQLDPELATFDLDRLAGVLRAEGDLQFDYLGLQTLYDRYFLHVRGTRYELPQAFFMRVAMGLALREIDREERAIEFYNQLSSFNFMASTPTLFNAGTLHSQLSSCFLSTVPDHLDGIFKSIKDNALLAKYSGGLGNDWSRVRGLGSHIKGTNGESQGVVPFLKVANDTAIAVNQCFAPETLVRTSEGTKAISSIRIGDLVLGVSGTYREVLKTFVYDQHGPMVRIDVKHSMSSLTVTDGHPLYAITGIPMAETVEHQMARIRSGSARMGWTDAVALKKGDYVGQTIPTEVVQADGIGEEEAFLYGVLLGDGHCTADSYEWGVSGDLRSKPYIAGVIAYLEARGIHYWKTERDENYVQVRWASGYGVVRDASRGRIVHAGPPTLPFVREDLYGSDGKKRVAPRLLHLPHTQTVALVHGLLASDGNVSRGSEITFSSSSEALAEGLRLQCLRLGVPTSGHSRKRKNGHDGVRNDGTVIRFMKESEEHVVRVPAFAEIAGKLGIPAVRRQNWLTVAGHVFSRVKSVRACDSVPVVHDLIVEGDESYMTVSGLAHNGGKRKGAVCAYLETWHIDIEEFLDLRKNTGDDRRRTHDMNTANWVPDMFMERVMSNGAWTLFSPDETPDLHDLYGAAFRSAYEAYEAKAAKGEIRIFKEVRALDLWRRMLTMIFETGHPWITWKDPCNIRSPQQHVGVVHSSNLCCMTSDQRVVTEQGILTVGELYAQGRRNKVLGRHGVEDASEMMLPRPNAPIVRLHTEEGYTHKITPDHKVWKLNYGWVEAQHLEPGDKIEIQQFEGMWGQVSNVDAAILCGFLAGDGTLTGMDTHIDLWPKSFPHQERIEAAAARVIAAACLEPVRAPVPANAEPVFGMEKGCDANARRRLSSRSLNRALAGLGVSHDVKLVVPDFVWKGTRETVAAYLEGLYVCDGTVQPAGDIPVSSLASVNQEFLREIQILLANFGIKSSLKLMRPAGDAMLPDGRGGEKLYHQQAMFRLLVTSIEGNRILEDITRIGEHRRNHKYLQRFAKQGYQQKMFATFEKLEALPNEDAYCLSVFTDEHSWTVNGLITKNTEITLNTSDTEVAVCNLGSINLPAHITDNGLDYEKLERTVHTAMRMLDNVVDINFYTIPEARRSNLRHRPVGLGIMGFQDALQMLRIPYSSEGAVEFADRSMEAVSYAAISASVDLAAERGRYASFEGSLWSKGILPIDSIALLSDAREGLDMEMDRSSTLDWESLRARVVATGMRNSNTMAIAPTATISNICGVSQSIEPAYQNLYVKSNMSGDFTVVNANLVHDLKARGLWDEVMVSDLKYFDGAVAEIARVPDDLKALYATAFEIDCSWLVDAASRRQKWIDQAQSLNLYIANPSGKKLDAIYRLAWQKGLKTTYYLRSRSASHVEKSTVKKTDGKLNAVSVTPASGAPTMASLKKAAGERPASSAPPEEACEACQ